MKTWVAVLTAFFVILAVGEKAFSMEDDSERKAVERFMNAQPPVISSQRDSPTAADEQENAAKSYMVYDLEYLFELARVQQESNLESRLPAYLKDQAVSKIISQKQSKRSNVPGIFGAQDWWAPEFREDFKKRQKWFFDKHPDWAPVTPDGMKIPDAVKQFHAEYNEYGRSKGMKVDYFKGQNVPWQDDDNFGQSTYSAPALDPMESKKSIAACKDYSAPALDPMESKKSIAACKDPLFDAPWADACYFNNIAVVNRPVNIQGLTGLIFTNTAFTQPKGRYAVGTSLLWENSNGAAPNNFSVVQLGATAIMGLTDDIEIGVKGKLVGINSSYSSSSAGVQDLGLGRGDTDILIKWRFLTQQDHHPAVALGLATSFPTGDNTKAYNEVNDESVRVMLIGSMEKKIFSDSFIGIYFDGQAVFNDVSRRSTSTLYDEYEIVNIGLLLPISDGNRLQAMLEYSRVFGKDHASLIYDKNYSGVTPGLRYVGDHIDVSIGLQLINQIQSQYPNDIKLACLIGYRF